MSSRTSSRSTLTIVPSTMSPSLKYLIVLSIAARKSSLEPMSLTATCGEVTVGLGILLGCSGQVGVVGTDRLRVEATRLCTRGPNQRRGYPAAIKSFMPNPQLPAAPPLPRRIRKVGAPLALIIALGIVIGVLLLLITVADPVRGIIGFILSTAAMSVVLFAYLWLDRWEPEPRRLLVLAFCWGASVAVILAVILEGYGD